MYRCGASLVKCYSDERTWATQMTATVSAMKVKFTLLGILRFSTGLWSAMLSWGLFRPCQNKSHYKASGEQKRQVTFIYILFQL